MDLCRLVIGKHDKKSTAVDKSWRRLDIPDGQNHSSSEGEQAEAR
jgi:hypothetical protein